MSAGSSSRKRLVHVAVPVPALNLLTYAVPDDLPMPVPGARVVVPLGTRVVTGLVVDDEINEPPPGEIKAVRDVLDRDAFVPRDIVGLARWTAEYYASGVGDAIPMLLPPMARGARADAHKTRRVASITPAGLEAIAQVAGKQREGLELLAGAPDGLPTAAIAARGISADAVSRLARRGYVSIRQDRVDRDPFLVSDPIGRSGTRPLASGDDRRLTAEQEAALKRLSALATANAFKVALLHGVTGSGKTEVYLRLAATVRDEGRQVLMLVPEIALTPAVAAQFRDAFGARVAIQHSGLSDGERHDQWQRIRRGEVDVVVGTRSAVFAPLDRVGLIVVDEEHDASYKQEESPRYNGRDVAIVRAQRARALVVLGSATPSMETYQNARTGKYERIVLARRVLDRPLASVTVVNMREEYAAEGPDAILSRRLRDGIAARLDRREQSLVLLNRRGYATAVFCRQCAGALDCPNCSVSLVLHGEGHARRARCHYCNYAARVPTRCPLCAGPYLEQVGFGTERVEAEVRKMWPGARVGRLDRDAIRRRGALDSLLSSFGRGEIDILVGTQMIAKGHDFPRVTLVGVVSADVGLGIADFRASERTFQLLTQVAGRAGRGEQPGEAIVQTLYPDHYSIQLACRQDFTAFFDKEMRFRRAMRYPPTVSLVNTIVRARTFAGAMDDAADVAERVRRLTKDRDDIRVLGPAPPPLGKLRGEYRVQLLLKGANRTRVREALQTALAARPDLQRRVVVDVDPLSVL
ncbi:MAG TPA: primosomal protein N' [Vicinamibacterales bacterium]|nr:primosomal protein N' [Vicinamibacterales bacterium]